MEEPKREDDIEETELEEQEGEALPEREQMSVVDLEGGLGPPPMA